MIETPDVTAWRWVYKIRGLALREKNEYLNKIMEILLSDGDPEVACRTFCTIVQNAQYEEWNVRALRNFDAWCDKFGKFIVNSAGGIYTQAYPEPER